MNIAIVFDSKTGNTQKIAESIKAALPSDCIAYYGAPKEGINADFYIVGSWTDKGSPSEDVAQFLRGLKACKVAYFGTSGVGRSQDYYASIAAKVETILSKSGNTLVDYYIVAGAMPMRILDKYKALLGKGMDDKVNVMIDNFNAVVGHPDSNDVSGAAKWAKHVLDTQNN